jgi:hypothetical protein
MRSKEDPKTNPMGNSELNKDRNGELGSPDTFDKCYLCGQWWWQRTMRLIRVPDQTGYVEKYVCLECIKEVSERSIKALKEIA